MKPHKKVEVTKTTITASGKKINTKTTTVGQSIFDVIHPNCITFNQAGRLFAGDSRGQISVWDVSLRYGSLIAENHFKIISRELDGDEINSIRVHPEHLN